MFKEGQNGTIMLQKQGYPPPFIDFGYLLVYFCTSLKISQVFEDVIGFHRFFFKDSLHTSIW